MQGEVVADADDVASLDVPGVPLGDVDRGALAGHGPVTIPAVDLDRPDPSLLPLGQQLDLVADADGAARGNPSDDGPVAFRGERPLDRETEDALRRLGRDGGHHRLEGFIEVLEALACDVGDRQDRGVLEECAGNELTHFLRHRLRSLGRDRVHFRQRHDPMLHAQQGQDIEVLAGLGHHAVVGGHDEDAAVDAAGAGHHGLDEILVAGDIDDADFQVGDHARREAQFDGHAAFLLDLEPVRVAAGQELDERGLAVVDVTRGADGDIVLLSAHVL